MSHLSITGVEALPETEEERVVSWRVAALVRAGYEEGSAIELAFAPGVDLHLAVRLLEAGCPAATAVRILL